MYHPPALILFARAPRPGETKTRLIPALGAPGAAELSRCFFLDTLAQIDPEAADVIVAAAHPGHVSELKALVEEAGVSANVTLQSGRDLGERLHRAFREALELGYPAVVIAGTDAPTLPWSRLSEALALALQGDVVLGPCRDGGYYLVGMHALIPQLFTDLPWSTPLVLTETLRRAKELKLDVRTLEPWYDVDTPEDLTALRAELAARNDAGQHIPCPHTWEYLRVHQRER